MSLQIPITTPITLELAPARTQTLQDSVTIERIVDIPSQKLVRVFIAGTVLELEELSGENYDTPEEWTNESIVQAVKNKLGID